MTTSSQSERAARIHDLKHLCREDFAAIWAPLLAVLAQQERQLGDRDVKPAASFADLKAARPATVKGLHLVSLFDVIFLLLVAGTKSVIDRVEKELDTLAESGDQRRLAAMFVLHALWERHHYALKFRDGEAIELTWSQIICALYDATNFDCDAMNDDSCFEWSGDVNSANNRPIMRVASL